DAARHFRESERDRLVHRLTVDREVERQADPPVDPDRLRIPLLREKTPLLAEELQGLQREPGRASDVLGEAPPQVVGGADRAAFQARYARDVVRNDLEPEPLDARLLPPVRLVRLEHELDARGERDEPVRSGADWRLLEAVVADLLDILTRY